MYPAGPNPGAMFGVSAKGVRRLETKAGPMENIGISNALPILPIETATCRGGCFFYIGLVLFWSVLRDFDALLDRYNGKLFRPSMCSYRLLSMCGAYIASRTKSIPSRLANLAAGTKSESPEISTILSTNFFKVIDAISTPIFISIPFCLISKYTSFSSQFVGFFVPLRMSVTMSARNCHEFVFSEPNRNATLRFFFNSSINSRLKIAKGDCPKLMHL